MVIVVSILLAFGIDASWEAAQDRARERAYLARMHDEFVNGLVNLERVLTLTVEAAAAMDSLIVWAKSGGPDDPVAIARTVLTAGDYEFISKDLVMDQAYQELISTGSLGLIRDAAIGERLTSYFDLVKRRGQVVDVYGSGSPEFRSFGNKVHGAVSGRWTRSSETRRTVREELLSDSAAVQRLVDLFPRSVEAQSELRLLIYWTRFHEAEMVQTIQETEELVALLGSI